GFCAECGSRITGGESENPSKEFIGITAGSLDDPSWFSPQMDFLRFGRAAVGPNGSGHSEIRTLSTSAIELVKHWRTLCPKSKPSVELKTAKLFRRKNGSPRERTSSRRKRSSRSSAMP